MKCKRYVCDTCGISFVSESFALSHRAEVHPLEQLFLYSVQGTVLDWSECPLCGCGTLGTLYEPDRIRYFCSSSECCSIGCFAEVRVK